MTLHLDILPDNQRGLLPHFISLRDTWYLAGGTALALQIGHRESVDFDFFCERSFDTAELFSHLVSVLPDCQKDFEEDNTLYITSHSVKCSFITYEYPLITDCVQTPSLRLAWLPDIAAMKLSAIQQRSTQKDYIDLYFLLKQYSLKELLDFYSQKFGATTNPILIRKYLTFFDDITPVDIPLHSDVSWSEIQAEIVAKATQFEDA